MANVSERLGHHGLVVFKHCLLHLALIQLGLRLVENIRYIEKDVAFLDQLGHELLLLRLVQGCYPVWYDMLS